LQYVGNVARWESELEPGPVRPRIAVAHRIRRRRRIDAEQQLDTTLYGPLDQGCASLRRDSGKCAQRFGGAPGAWQLVVCSAAIAGAFRAGRVIPDAAVTRCDLRLPRDRALHPRIVQPAKPDQRPQQVSRQAMDGPRRRGNDGFVLHTRGSEAAIFRLSVSQHIGACRANPRVGRVGAELVEEDELPDRTGVFGAVAGTRLDPVAIRLVVGQDRSDGMRLHRRAERGDDVLVGSGAIQEIGQSEVPQCRRVLIKQPLQRVGSKPVQGSSWLRVLSRIASRCGRARMFTIASFGLLRKQEGCRGSARVWRLVGRMLAAACR
jgi:hypothetical protein